MTHPVITKLIVAGYLEPCVILDGEGRELRGYRPTAKNQRWFGAQFAAREIERENVVDLREVRQHRYFNSTCGGE